MGKQSKYYSLLNLYGVTRDYRTQIKHNYKNLSDIIIDDYGEMKWQEILRNLMTRLTLWLS